MSFAKSKTKRFNEIVSCAPPPGAYDPKLLDKVPGVYIIKEKRFKDITAVGGDISICSYGSLETLTPKKSMFSSSTKKNVKSAKKTSPGSFKFKELETELKQKVYECNNLQQSLLIKEDEVKKLGGRIQQLQKDKSALEANLATVKKEIAFLKKSNQALKQNCDEDTKKAVADAKRPLLEEIERIKAEDVKNKSQLKAVKEELEQKSREVDSLREAYSNLKRDIDDKINHAKESIQKQLITEQEKMNKLHQDEQKFTKSIVKNLEEKLKHSEECNAHLIEYRDSLVKEINCLKEVKLEMGVQKFEDDNFIRHLKGEVFAMKDEAVKKQEELEEAMKKITELEKKIILKEESHEDELTSVKTECYHLKERLATMEMAFDALQQQFHGRQQECESLKNSNDELSESLTTQQELYECLENNMKLEEEKNHQLSSKLADMDCELSDAHLLNIQLENEIQSINWDKGCLEGELADLRQQQQQLRSDKERMEVYYEGRLKDLQGQIVMMHDIVDNKQSEIDALKARTEVEQSFEQSLEQLRNELLFERQTNRTREFLLQEQEKENWKELERAQRAEKEMRNKLDVVIKENTALQDELSNIREQYRCLESSHQHQVQEIRDKLRQTSLNAAQYNQKLTQLEERLHEKNTLLKEKEQQNQELEKLLQQKDHSDEAFMWKEKYETLYQKVLPFEEQLEAYETEKKFLLGLNKNTQLEVQKLSQQYAKLLGHQNQKQRIKYVEKINAENNSMKLELAKLKELVTRQKRQISKLESHVKSCEGKKPLISKSKENQTPLREGNN